MKINRKIWIRFIPISIAMTAIGLNSCEEFFNPRQALIIKEDNYYKNWYEYRAAEMGLYALQQKLVDQIIILGELRGDLLEITPNANMDLRDIYNFQISSDNKYASPNNFYELISACNNLARKLEQNHPEVLTKTPENTNYDRLYGEVLCMRAWANFNAVKIFGRIPYIHPSLTTPQEVEEYINSSQTYYDVNKTIYDRSGLDSTITIDTVALEKIYLDMDMVIDTFTTQLPKRIKAVGVIHNIDNGDQTWDVTVWNDDAYFALMGEMHLFNSNLTEAYNYFYPIMFNFESEGSFIKYGLDNKFSNSSWRNIFTGIDPDEHILTLQFDKTYQQQHELQTLFSILPPNKYMLKPTGIAIDLWETIWKGQKLNNNISNPDATFMDEIGIPGDFSRGYAVSYAYRKGQELLSEDEVRLMMDYKISNNYMDIENLMDGVDTVVYKYTLNKDVFDHDANIIICRAANIHLYCAEIYTYWLFDFNGDGKLNTYTNLGLAILNNGAYKFPPDISQLGVRGRVGFEKNYDAVTVANIIYKHDPYTNNVIGYYDFTNNTIAKQEYLEEQILDERARELAYEGHRFYDLMRVAKRRNDPSFLADKVAAKFSGSQAEQIRELLKNEENWYVPLPE